MFDFLGNHPRSPEKARVAAVVTVVLAVILGGIAMSLFLTGSRGLGVFFVAITVAGLIVNFLRVNAPDDDTLLRLVDRPMRLWIGPFLAATID